MVVYQVRNLRNGKCYIGQTMNDVARRWAHHRWVLRNHRHNNCYLQRAWDKHGEAAFIFEILDQSAKTIDELNALETFYVATTPNLYNLTSGGRNGKCSEETKRKLSRAGKGKAPWIRGKHHSAETRKKMSEQRMGNQNCLGRKASDDTRCKLSESHKGHKHSIQTRHKMSESAKRRWRIHQLKVV